MTAALDSAFADELDEIVESVLLPYRPILSHAVMGQFRQELQHALESHEDLRSWRIPIAPVEAAGSLTPGQVALLGGTRPTRLLHTVAHRLSLLLDGGDKRSLRDALQLLLSSHEALDSLVEHHVVTPVGGRAARTRKVRELVRLGVAAQLAALMGALHEHCPGGGHEPEDELLQRYFLAAWEAFGRLRLRRRDQEILREHYLDEAHIEELADERGSTLAQEIERRRGFLKRLATALEARSDGMPGAALRQLPGAGHGDGDGDGDGAGDARPRALTSATGRAARPRRQ